MKTLFKHTVDIYKKPIKYSWKEDSFKIEEVSIIAENDNYIIIDDPYFTKLEKKGDGHGYYVLNKESISIRTNDHILDDGVFYCLYSEKKVKPDTIKRHIEMKIAGQYGWLMNSLDLSIIK